MVDLSIIKTLTKQRGITLKSVAEQCGISQQAICSIMKKNSCGLDTLDKIAQVLQVSPAVFFEPDAQEEKTATSGNNSCCPTVDRVTELMVELKQAREDNTSLMEMLKTALMRK